MEFQVKKKPRNHFCENEHTPIPGEGDGSGQHLVVDGLNFQPGHLYTPRFPPHLQPINSAPRQTSQVSSHPQSRMSTPVTNAGFISPNIGSYNFSFPDGPPTRMPTHPPISPIPESLTQPHSLTPEFLLIQQQMKNQQEQHQEMIRMMREQQIQQNQQQQQQQERMLEYMQQQYQMQTEKREQEVELQKQMIEKIKTEKKSKCPQ